MEWLASTITAIGTLSHMTLIIIILAVFICGFLLLKSPTIVSILHQKFKTKSFRNKQELERLSELENAIHGDEHIANMIENELLKAREEFDKKITHMKDVFQIDLKIRDIEKFEIPRDQMELVERTIDKIEIGVLEAFHSLFEDDKQETRRQVRQYNGILLQSLVFGKARVKSFISKNHLIEKSPQEFEAYIKETSEEILNIVIHKIDSLYFSEDFSVTRQQVKAMFKKGLYRDLLEEIGDLLRGIKEILKIKSIDITRLESTKGRGTY